MKPLSRNAIIGYPSGIITGITYGLNPLFAVPLMKNGAAIESILFFRYAIAVLLLGVFPHAEKREFQNIAKTGGSIVFTRIVLYDKQYMSVRIV